MTYSISVEPLLLLMFQNISKVVACDRNPDRVCQNTEVLRRKSVNAHPFQQSVILKSDCCSSVFQHGCTETRSAPRSYAVQQGAQENPALHVFKNFSFYWFLLKVDHNVQAILHHEARKTLTRFGSTLETAIRSAYYNEPTSLFINRTPSELQTLP